LTDLIEAPSRPWSIRRDASMRVALRTRRSEALKDEAREMKLQACALPMRVFTAARPAFRSRCHRRVPDMALS
jgi:hypothetical protein